MRKNDGLNETAPENPELMRMSVVITGHVDSGKSTTTGHLLCKLGGVDARKLEKLKARAEELGMGSFYYAYLMDGTKEEQRRGVTIKCSMEQFFTPRYNYSIIDAPGHRDFIKNMINGAGQADVAVLMVPADGNFIDAIRKGGDGEIMGQTRQHARLLQLLGVKQLIVCVNKMDYGAGDHDPYSEARFEEVRDEMMNMLRQVGYGKMFVQNRVPVIPISGWMGDNLLEVSENMPWWTGQTVSIGKEAGQAVHVSTLVQALDEFVQPIQRHVEQPLRMPVSGVFNLAGIGTVITGRVEQGCVRCKDEVVFLPTHTTANPSGGKVFSIEMHRKPCEIGVPGDNIGLNMRGLNKANLPRVGDVMVLDNDASLQPTASFTAQVHVLDIPRPVKVGYSPIAFVRTAKAACRITQILWRSHPKETGGQPVPGTELKPGDCAEVVLEPQVPLVVETYAECEGLGRIAFMDGSSPVMLGKVVAVNGNVVQPDANKTVAAEATSRSRGRRGGKQASMTGDQRKVANRVA
eukprot:TRINITY_DN11125_c0_g1_i1.p1 TRINITY_DN11125_c0_g1~~TRINITY_DN11125_c0_g1_i1.p1  ORF type:complete len:520 (+),score=156.22 TRINITY_DN11125_c0_g1_i1:203-1762(+)